MNWIDLDGRKLTKRVCVDCGREYSFCKGKGNGGRKFCSERCRQNNFRKIQKIAYAEYKERKTQ